MDRETLLKLLEDDDLDLLKIESNFYNNTSDERFLASFQEINDFIRENGHEPKANTSDVREYQLSCRLDALRQDQDKAQVLKEHDVFGLLISNKAMRSIDDIFNDDDLGILENKNDIFDLKHVPKDISVPDYIAQRKPCKNFDTYEHLFKQCHNDLAAGKRQLWPFAKEQQIEKGDFFVLKGILTYVTSVGEKETVNGKTNARLLCIFENGTESDMLLRSLARELYKNGRRVTAHEDRLLDGFDCLTTEDEVTGYIYVLKSLSDRPEIKSIDHLYKIGFSRVPIEKRIKNAIQEPTYLMAPVALIASYQCYNLNPQKLELLLHTFFASACLNIDVFDSKRIRYSPREWFKAPLNVIEQAIHFLITGDILQYRYDPERQTIVGK
jgi:hypothetical protein